LGAIEQEAPVPSGSSNTDLTTLSSMSIQNLFDRTPPSGGMSLSMLIALKKYLIDFSFHHKAN